MKTFLLALVSLLSFATVRAQSGQNPEPARWEITAAAAEDGFYNIDFHIILSRGWHVWSMNPGADKSLVPPSISIDLKTAMPEGPPSEQGIATETQLEGVDGLARFYYNEALFVQKVRASKGKTVKGSYTYQLCNDKLCLPPKTVPFAVTLP